MTDKKKSEARQKQYVEISFRLKDLYNELLPEDGAMISALCGSIAILCLKFDNPKRAADVAKANIDTAMELICGGVRSDRDR